MRKKRIGLLLFLAVVLLAGCSGSPDYKVEIKEQIYTLKDKPSQIAINVMEDGEPVSGLKITGELTMVDMDHGTMKAEFAENEKGTYKAETVLPMAGKYEMALTINHDGDKTEKIVEFDVKKNEGVALINGEWVTDEDIKFYTFINKLHTAINREQDKEKYSGKELEEALAYWDAQDKINEDKNQLLTQIIRLRSVAMLAKEKGHSASQVEVERQLDDIKKQYSQFDIAPKMIADFGEEQFWAKERSQYEMIVLTQKVQQDLIERAKKENPKAGEQEIQYIAQMEYEELLVSQVNSLDIVIL
ncbi:hypothetical protein D1B31_06745 [Neobacillus notoginsengisoli]|uniref:YtkA-like domain-containing protein n=1 Tax=Neobacillus notoginsengisoli TaxID=1578198 RepID=A0A417YVW5_9BACI|nr:FixH family protein [Neobacillus notoginsengisoli]RHW41421.1 hypothetical protein D1B31_06745 [Neobacillus notoginsengisoli]